MEFTGVLVLSFNFQGVTQFCGVFRGEALSGISGGKKGASTKKLLPSLAADFSH